MMTRPIDGIRRTRAAELGLPEAVAEALVNLRPRCDWRGHDEGGPDGQCREHDPGEYVVRLRPHCIYAEVEGMPHVAIIVCLARQIWLRSTRNQTYVCDCGQTVTWGSVIDFLGPVEEFYP